MRRTLRELNGSISASVAKVQANKKTRAEKMPVFLVCPKTAIMFLPASVVGLICSSTPPHPAGNSIELSFLVNHSFVFNLIVLLPLFLEM